MIIKTNSQPERSEHLLPIDAKIAAYSNCSAETYNKEGATNVIGIVVLDYFGSIPKNKANVEPQYPRQYRDT